MTAAEEDAPIAKVRRAPAERAARALLPACAGTWTAAEIMHLTGVQWIDVIWGTAALAATGYARTARKAKGEDAWRHARHVAAGITMAGTWLAAATAAGPLAGPDGALTWTWAGTSLAAAWWVHRHEIVAAARDWRLRRAGWHDTARRWHLRGSFLLHHEYTRLGEMMIADVTGTGRLASDIARSNVSEWIAQDRGVPRSRVKVEEAPGPAGRVMISIRERDPWAHPVTHPVLAEEPEIDLPVPCSVRKPAVVGQDPESGRVLDLPLCDERGGKNISVVAIKGGGKTVLLSCLSERVTAAPDAILIRINLSLKGDAEQNMWAPACLLTALGRKQAKRAVRILRIVNKIIEWRSQQPRTTADFIPSRDNPLIVLMIDEEGSATEIPAVRRELDPVARQGREFGVTLVTADQRGTADRQGGADIRSQQDVFCIGMVNRRGEMMHAAGDLGLEMPDMASYGEGRAGVWVVAELGGGHRTGRTFALKEPADIRAIAEERADFRPVLPESLAAWLGEEYEHLLGTDAYARWAAGREPVTQGAPSPWAASPAPEAEGQRAATAVIDREGILATLDQEAERYVDELDDGSDLRKRLAEMKRKNNDTQRFINETAAMDVPELPSGQMEAIAAERWRMIEEATEITGGQRDILAVLLGRGTTISEVMAVLEVTRWEARGLLGRLRGEGLAVIDGKGRGARWRSPAPENGDGS